MARPRSLAAAAAARGVVDGRVLEAIAGIPRAQFVPAQWVARAYVDEPLPLPHGQVTTQPSLSAQMIEALRLCRDGHVLEIGTGYGFQTALLARLVARVYSIERFEDFASAARHNVDRLSVDNVEIVVGDGTEGLPHAAPFDAVIVSAAFPRVPSPLVDQLRAGGRLVQPIGPGGNEDVVAFRKDGAVLVREAVISGARFVPLTGRHGYED